MEWYEVAFGELYPVVYGRRDAAEAARTVGAFGELLSGRGPVLDLACGAGRHLEALAAYGV
ncbi:MAG: class I SAM-dependent methyltransferase, partial [Candidatus Krumholzibacteria bacterium]|nr:class I SAM-dependent methyltransferase [Candidatus Krumholzibacteria bacterium]